MKDFSESCFKTTTLHAFTVAAWGACVGYLLVAVLVIPMIFTESKRGGPEIHVLSPGCHTHNNSSPWQSVIQKRMYVLNCFVCSLCALGALALRSRLNGWACIIGMVLFVPFITKSYANAFDLRLKYSAMLAATAALLLPCLPWRRWFARIFSSSGPRLALASAGPLPRDSLDGDADHETTKAFSPQSSVRRTWRLNAAWLWTMGLAIALLGFIAMFVLPRHVTQYAPDLRSETHLCSYLIAPALNFLDPDRVPGLDFESHYGVGHAYVFSFFLGQTFNQTLTRFIWFLFIVLSFFYLTAYFVLHKVLRSAFSAFLVVLLLLLSCNNTSLRTPPNWQIHSPFVFLLIYCAWREEMFGRRWLPAAAAGIMAGLSFFWQTHVGLCVNLAGFTYFAALTARQRQGFLRVPLFLGASSAAIVLLFFASCGPRTLSLEFYQRLFDPLLPYVGGWAFHPMSWVSGDGSACGFLRGWIYLYNVISPVVLFGTAGWSFWYMSDTAAQERSDARFLFLNATIATAMLFKWTNRSFDIVWVVNGFCALVVLCFWVRYVIVLCTERLAAWGTLSARWLTAGRLQWATGTFLILLLTGQFVVAGVWPDKIPTSLRGYILCQINHQTPTRASLLLSTYAPFVHPSNHPARVDRADIELIDRYTRPTEPVAIISPLDWVYLAEAHRAPAFPFTPIWHTYSKHLMSLVEHTMSSSTRIFACKEDISWMKATNPDVYDCVFSALQRDFILVESGAGLNMYERKDTRAAYLIQRR